jgi:hypothetical protein
MKNDDDLGSRVGGERSTGGQDLPQPAAGSCAGSEAIDAFKEQVLQQVARRAERGDAPDVVGLWLIEQLAMCRRELSGAIAMPDTEGAHSLTLQFHRILSNDEMREVIALARAVPYLKGIRVDFTPVSS